MVLVPNALNLASLLKTPLSLNHQQTRLCSRCGGWAQHAHTATYRKSQWSYEIFMAFGPFVQHQQWRREGNNWDRNQFRNARKCTRSRTRNLKPTFRHVVYDIFSVDWWNEIQWFREILFCFSMVRIVFFNALNNLWNQKSCFLKRRVILK